MLVERSVQNEFVERLASIAKDTQPGHPLNPDSKMGAIVNEEQMKRIVSYIEKGKQNADLIIGGEQIKVDGKGCYVQPTIFNNVNANDVIAKEEIFGPVLSVVRAKNYEEALELVNNHIFGNGTSIYTSDGEVSRHFTTNSKIGMVGVNVPIPVPMAFHSFGGWKRSLFGDQHMHGPEGVRFYTKLKTITSRWPSGLRSDPEFVMPTMK